MDYYQNGSDVFEAIEAIEQGNIAHMNGMPLPVDALQSSEFPFESGLDLFGD
jgi:hypothetical protein